MSWSTLGRGARKAGAATGRAALFAGRGLASAYHAVDPDLRRHVAQLPLLGLGLFTKARPEVTPLPADGHRPVIFVHGLGGHRGNFLPARAYFRLRGRSRTYALGFSSGTEIPALAVELSRFIAEVVGVNGLAADAQVDLVAHSMGGLIARVSLEDSETRRRVATVVTLGTPHHGTHAARFAATPHHLSLRPDSPLLQRLAHQVPWDASQLPRLYALWSESDVLLLPATTAKVEGAESIRMDGYTHYSYLLQPAGFEKIFECLSPTR